ncbi:beta-1,6-N-acetylglucosaminyltransferase [Neobacillus sp. PS2-9]|uniref:beta-1,6-N-acetylglucosaminyltransferase n=1 Tax=Neobacillus sp. PS2-9 TaxID=3070676 RepID=UPI0027DF9799|nr:beta-1,6-N-acetylglucosaminyltransferase [Neobacillus sp. PS2-9]WML59310.1 beta-1,6-N-acetylglucosaminyltransferase [Neobacillus sp. PS2-9]
MNSSPRTAYILQIHKNPDQVNKFINQLISGDQADVFVHIDKRNYEDMNKKIIKSPNVKVLQKSIVCEWGHISQVETTIHLLREVLASKNKYDFVCLRSGQDLLVKDGFKDFLLNNKGKIFMDFINITWKNEGAMRINWPNITRKRYTSAHPFRIYRRTIKALYDKGINLFPNTNYWPKEYSFYCGSQWFTIPSNVANYIIEFLDNNTWYLQYFKNTYTPDEWFFHTLIMNSHFKCDVVNNNLLYLRMGEKLSERNSPVYLTSKDINIIENSNQFFARKFDDTIDYSVVEYFAKKACFVRGKAAV